MSTSKPHPSHPLLGRTAVRPAWDTLPEPVRRVVAAHLGAAVEAASGPGWRVHRSMKRVRTCSSSHRLAEVALSLD